MMGIISRRTHEDAPFPRRADCSLEADVDMIRGFTVAHISMASPSRTRHHFINTQEGLRRRALCYFAALPISTISRRDVVTQMPCRTPA